LKYFVQAVNFRCPNQKLLLHPNFSLFSCRPL
jgi:hypothetical protein